MAERLAAIRREAEARPGFNPAWNEVWAQALQRQLDEAQAQGQSPRVLALLPQVARQWLNAGHNERALRTYARYRGLVEQASWRLDTRQTAELELQTALTYLRIAEQDNCLDAHHAYSCLFPIQDLGVHAYQRGARGAIRVLTAWLGNAPDDLAARWLLNLAHMTVGDYPDGVPVAWRIPPRTFASEIEFPRFPEIAGALGLDVDGHAGGVVMEDFDGDGWLDLLVSSSSLEGSLRLFRNQGDGTFIERTTEAGLTGLVGGLNLIHADYDNDGWPDVLVLRGAWWGPAGHHPNSLLRNLGDGRFEDVTEAAGVLSLHPTGTAVWFDYNGDGWLDLFVGNESTDGDPNPCELFRNNGDGTFTECAHEAGVDVTAFIKAAVSADFDGDGRPDLFLANLNGPNRLLRNLGPASPAEPLAKDSRARPAATRVAWRFADVAASAGVTRPEHSFPAMFWDYDNDGWPDLLVTGYAYRGVGDIAADYLGLPHGAEKARLYHNTGHGTFEDVTAAMGLDKVLLAMGANYGDLDNDGWLDLYVGTGDPDLATIIPNRLFRNAAGRRFQEVTSAAGLGHLQKGHGIAFGDLDNDGDQDVYEVMGGAFFGDHYRNVLYENPGFGRGSIHLTLEGVRANRSAIGARLRLVVEEPAEGGGGVVERSLYRTVGSGGSFGASPLRQEIGLGQARRIRRLEIDWPAPGGRQVVTGLEPDRDYRIRERDPDAVAVPRRSLNFARPVEPRGRREPGVR